MIAEFYTRPVVEVARDLVGCVVAHDGCSGVIVETEAYHDSEPACHAFVGLTQRTSVLFGPPGRAYVYRSYGIHALLNAVSEPPGVGAAVLIRALEPLDGVAVDAEAPGTEGTAVRALASSSTGFNMGIYAETNSTDGIAGVSGGGDIGRCRTTRASIHSTNMRAAFYPRCFVACLGTADN